MTIKQLASRLSFQETAAHVDHKMAIKYAESLGLKVGKVIDENTFGDKLVDVAKLTILTPVDQAITAITRVLGKPITKEGGNIHDWKLKGNKLVRLNSTPRFGTTLFLYN